MADVFADGDRIYFASQFADLAASGAVPDWGAEHHADDDLALEAVRPDGTRAWLETFAGAGTNTRQLVAPGRFLEWLGVREAVLVDGATGREIRHVGRADMDGCTRDGIAALIDPRETMRHCAQKALGPSTEVRDVWGARGGDTIAETMEADASGSRESVVVRVTPSTGEVRWRIRGLEGVRNRENVPRRARGSRPEIALELPRFFPWLTDEHERGPADPLAHWTGVAIIDLDEGRIVERARRLPEGDNRRLAPWVSFVVAHSTGALLRSGPYVFVLSRDSGLVRGAFEVGLDASWSRDRVCAWQRFGRAWLSDMEAFGATGHARDETPWLVLDLETGAITGRHGDPKALRPSLGADLWQELAPTLDLWVPAR